MSKGLGQKIAIKFTEDLVGDVSGKDTATPYSFYRWYITSTWSSSGRLYLYELEFFSNGIKVDTNKIISMAGSSRYSSSYDVNRLFDGSVPGTAWDANGPLPHWVSIELDEAIVIDSFRWHTGTSGNKPKEFILQGSNDGINWVGIHMDESPNLNNWIDFVVAGVGNEIAFTVTGKEYQYVNGPLIDKEYQVEKVERYGAAMIWSWGSSASLEADSILEDFEDDILHPSLSLTGTWTRSTRDAQTGSYSLESNNKTHNSDTSAYLTFNASAGKSFSIGYKVSSEANYDKFYLYHNDVVKVNGISGAGSWLTYNGITTEGTNVIRVRYTKDGSTSRNLDAGFIDNFYLEGNYYTPKIINIDGIAYTGQCRVKWQEDKPTGTDITIEYTTGEAQGEWVEVSNGEVITSDTNLWFRVTLETTDTSVTPTLHDLWVEEPEAPNDQIRLVMHPQSRFNNVVGPLTVQYDQTVGSLRGRGGPVEGFTETFTPTDLEPKPNPHVAENIEVSAEASADFMEVTYNQAYAGEQITVSASATADFIYVGIINP